MTTWGLVSTILAPTGDILRFAAYHLEHGAHRLFIYLDDENPDAFAALKSHPKIRVQTCDAAYWNKRGGKRPAKHQVRQTANATRTYRRCSDVDWLGHIDVDEFLVSRGSVSEELAVLPAAVATARMRPMELLADGDGTAFKGFIPAGAQRKALIPQLYPNFGRCLRGGFLSHASGKLFLRTGLENVSFRIHKAFQDDAEIPGGIDLDGIDLAHCHAKSWDDWQSRFQYRLEHGAYRAELDQGRDTKVGTMRLHDLFVYLEQNEGKDGLRAFYHEVVADTPQMRAKLDAHGLLRQVSLDLERNVRKHFPDFV